MDAKRIYESSLGTDPELLGGLYNNMGISCVALKRYSEAHTFYNLALETMRQVPGSALEQAITCLNMADALDAEGAADADISKLMELLRRTKELILNSDVERNGYFAYVCERCAPGFR